MFYFSFCLIVLKFVAIKKRLCSIRALYQYKYSIIELDENPIITYFIMYLK